MDDSQNQDHDPMKHGREMMQPGNVKAADLPESAKAPQSLQHFKFDHLPPHLQDVSRPFCELAAKIEEAYKDGPEKTACLRKLLEAKDCAVRAQLDSAV